jgi:hypothetical protein
MLNKAVQDAGVDTTIPEIVDLILYVTRAECGYDLIHFNRQLMTSCKGPN